MERKKIFFSYSQKDTSDLALKLYGDLQSAGADVWIDQQDIHGGENYNESIEKALIASNCILYIVSEKSLTSKYVLAEVHYAIDEEKVVIPIITVGCKLPLRLRGLQQIDFSNDYNIGFKRLLKALQLDNEPDDSNKKVNNDNETEIKPGDIKKSTDSEKSDNIKEPKEDGQSSFSSSIYSTGKTTAKNIFICYRVRDTGGETGRLVENLLQHFSKDQIFVDMIDKLEPGADFEEVLVKQLKKCDVMLAVIGPFWLGNGDGKPPKIQNPNDWVRLELARALRLNIRVVPVLVDGAVLPSYNDLPEELHPLLTRKAFEITNKRWRYDTDQLINFLIGSIGIVPVNL